MRRRSLAAITVVYLLASMFYLLSPGERAWAVPGQNPHRQSSPTRTPTPEATVPPADTPRSPGEAGAPPSPPPEGALALPPTTVTPLFLTLFPPTATPRRMWVAATWEVEPTVGQVTPTGRPSPDPTEARLPSASRTPAFEGTAVTAPPGSRAVSAGGLGASTVLDCVVMAVGLVLLSIGLVLVGSRQR